MKRFILTNKRKKKEEWTKLIKQKIGEVSSIIDISCGEDQFIFNLARKDNIPLCVGNDISWSQIESLNKKFKEVIFTNHNASVLLFKENIFDVSYCSNTLHHMPSKKVLINMLESMFKVAKKVIIVEIEDPKVTGGFPKLLNKYWFGTFLKDVGRAYLSAKDFNVIINNTFKGKELNKIVKSENKKYVII